MPGLIRCQSYSLQSDSRRDLLRFGLGFGLATGVSNAWSGFAAAKPQRIVCAGGALTEIIYGLNAQDDLVGVDTTSLYPAMAQKLPSVGYVRALSAEGVLALAPTQVIATEDAGPPAVLQQISAAGVAVNILPANHRFEGVLERVKRVGDLTGRVRQAVQLNQSLRQEWQATREAMPVRSAKPVRVLFVLAHGPSQVLVSGRNTAADAMITYARASNAITAFEGYKPLTPEAVIAAQADVLLLTEQGKMRATQADGSFKIPGIERTPAGARGRGIALDAMFLLGFGPRLPAAVATLQRAINQAMST